MPEDQQAAHLSKYSSALIVDDHPLFCDALTMTLKTAVGIKDIRVADRLERALASVEEEGAPDVALLDLNLPDVSGLDGLTRLKTALGATPVIVVSSLTDDRVVRMAFHAGASGFVPKHSQSETFRTALATVALGDVFAPPGFEPGCEGEETDAIRRLSLLTLQQAKILSLVCEGRLNKQIAFDLSIAETTVKAHMTAILRKLGVQSRTQAVLIAQEANFSKLLQDSVPSA